MMLGNAVLISLSVLLLCIAIERIAKAFSYYKGPDDDDISDD